jgi:large subunit ribosomal protein L6
MSRVGKSPIPLPGGVELNVNSDNVVTVKGPKGELQQKLADFVKVEVKDGSAELSVPSAQNMHKAQHGLYRALINNMVVGVTDGFKTEQELIGVGYRANVTGQRLELSLGYSHPIIFELPAEVKVDAISEKGKAPRVTLESIDKQLIGHCAAKIRSFRPPEPYKGKGIRFVGEQIRRKAGKTAAK